MASNAAAVASTLARRAQPAAPALPCGRRVPRGRERWYLLKVREGSEAAACGRLLRLVPRELLADCFCVGRERWFTRAGRSELQEAPAYRGYAFAVTADPGALAKALGRLPVRAELVGTEGRMWAPLDRAAQAWYERCMDGKRVLRSSTAAIVDGVLHVTEGPLVGQEAVIRKVDRHRRLCEVEVCPGFTERMPLDVPFKS